MVVRGSVGGETVGAETVGAETVDGETVDNCEARSSGSLQVVDFRGS